MCQTVPGKDWRIEVEANATVFRVKEHISRHYEGNPPIDAQRLVHFGRLLQDGLKIKDLGLQVDLF